MEITVQVRREDDHYWAEVQELPGCFASGRTLDELVLALQEAVQLYLENDDSAPDSVSRAHLEIGEFKALVAA